MNSLIGYKIFVVSFYNDILSILKISYIYILALLRKKMGEYN